jgi:uncharacterized protein with HEPN domain
VRGDIERLQDILEAIAAIEPHVAMGREAFDADPMVQVWLIRHIQNIGEAARVLPAALKARHAEVPWRDINGMRNILVHVYHGVAIARVWAVAERFLPTLKTHVETILSELRGGE